MTQKEAAQAVGYADPNSVKNFELGRAVPKPETLVRFADIYQSTVNYIMFGGAGGHTHVGEGLVDYSSMREKDRRLIREIDSLLKERGDEVRSDFRRLVDLLKKAG